MTQLLFPGVAEDLSDAFNNALDAGAMDRGHHSDKFWAKFQYLASEIDDDEVVQWDWFFHEHSNIYHKIARKENPT